MFRKVYTKQRSEVLIFSKLMQFPIVDSYSGMNASFFQLQLLPHTNYETAFFSHTLLYCYSCEVVIQKLHVADFCQCLR